MLKKILFIGTHSIFWIVFISFSLIVGYRLDAGSANFLHYYKAFFIQLIWAVLAFYTAYNFLTIKFFERKKLFSYLLISIVLSLIFTGVFASIILLVYFDEWNKLVVLSLRSVFGTFIIMQCGVLLRGFLNWFNDLERKSELEKRNLQNELNFLKQQLNPHFLFNTLNNIDAMILSNPKEASRAIILLSEMLRYMIYETNNEKVLLINEKNYLQNLVSLHALRHKKTEFIHFSTNIESENIEIAPIIFLPFVENAFKFASDIGIYPCISIELKYENDAVIFNCSNYYNPSITTKNTNCSGVGLKNAQKRLNLIYPKKHYIEVNILENKYIVNLSIIIS